LNKKIIYTILFILLVVFTGFIRETYFVRIAWCEAVVSGQATAPQSHWLFYFLESFSSGQLSTAKYIGTLFFILVFWLLGLLMIRWFFKSSANFKLVHFAFLIPFCTGTLIFTLGLLFPGQKSFYDISRWIIGLIETPLIIMILFPAMWVKEKTT
jgi:hypothetical protein